MQLKHKSGEQIVDEDIAKTDGEIKMYSITKSKTTKRYAIFICLVYIFVFKDWMEQYIPVVGYMDELFAVLSIPVFVFELKKNQFKLKIQKCTWGGMLGSF